MPNVHRFLNYSEITDNDTYIGVPINIEGLTLNDIEEAIEMQKWLKKCEIKLSNNDIMEIENLKDWKKRYKKLI